MVCGSGTRPACAFRYVLVVSFIIASLRFSYCTVNNNGCPEIEKEALLSFKKSSAYIPSPDYDSPLSSWNESHSSDCCMWEGVVCNNLTDHVQQLHLQRFFGTYDLPVGFNLINPSLFNLKYLTYLDLSHNYFQGTIPALIGSFAKLEYLNLSANEFYGNIPPTIGNLSSLCTLSLGPQYYNGNEFVGDLEWLSGLPHLEHLDMSYVNLSKASDNWVEVINTLPSLLELNFSGCSLEVISPLTLVNFTSLVFLDLSDNNFHSVVPRWVFQLNKLTHLDLSFNHFVGLIPSNSNITKLQYIDLYRNNFNSTIPDWIYANKPLEYFDMRGNKLLHGSISNAIENLTSLTYLDLSSNEISGEIPIGIAQMCKMKYLDLSFNKLEGNISNTFGNMSNCFLGVMENLRLSGNQLSGHLTDNFGEFESLQTLYLANSLLSGPIPVSLGNLSSLEALDLSMNKLTGNLPESFGQLLNLESLHIADNMLEGVVTESHFTNLTKLSWFFASRNSLSFKVDQNWIPPFKLRVLLLSSWHLGAGNQIPAWLDTQKNHLEALDLSNTGISVEVPSWFWQIPFFLNLSNNQLSGRIPSLSGPRFMYLSSNKFNGSLPPLGISLRGLDLSKNSISGNLSHFLCAMANGTYTSDHLHLGGNQSAGKLPTCWSEVPQLVMLNLESNNISGSIPDSIGSLKLLYSLNLHNNSLSGQIPSSIQNCTELLKIDLGNNKLVGNVPAWQGTSLLNLAILILRSNKLNGEIPYTICHLNSLRIFDLSDNILSGKIPLCIGNFTGMATKEQRLIWYYPLPLLDTTYAEGASVHVKGTIREYSITILPLVTNIDLSDNNLSGEIPKEITSLVELRLLRLSMNSLSGTIPDGIDEMKQLESLDLSRNSISGEIPNTFTVLTSLNHLDLSFNNLIGRIPKSTQLQSFNASSFIGNKLCDPPLTVKCNNGGGTSDRGYQNDNKRSFLSKVDWFYVLLSLGYAVGFSVVCTTLVLKESWRNAYFQALDDMWN